MGTAITHKLESRTHLPVEHSRLHVISLSKLAIMGIFSIGLYIAYWNYRHWLLIRGERGFKVIPLLCTIFGAITMYFLMKKIVMRSREANQPVEGSALGVTLMYWIPCLMVFTWDIALAEHALESLPLLIVILASLILPIIRITFLALSILQIQQTANVCEGDPLGLQNSQITWANVLWIVIVWISAGAILSYLLIHGSLM